jgi:hypothetical protein
VSVTAEALPAMTAIGDLLEPAEVPCRVRHAKGAGVR